MAKPYEDLKPLDHQNLNTRQFGGLVRNVVNQYRAATPEQHEDGRTWYDRAHDVASEVGRGDTKTGAGVLAALSPRTEWGLNVAQARQMGSVTTAHVRALQAGDRSSVAGTPLARQYTANIVKAHRIREGEAPEAALPQDLKTGHFYHNIADPASPHHVTVDSIAADVARNYRQGSNADRGLQAPGRYGKYVDVYKAAAKHVEEPLPQRVQATTWVATPRVRGRNSPNRGKIV